MMTLKRKAFKKLYQLWDKFYNNNTLISPYMDYKFQKYYRRTRFFSKYRFNMRCYYYVVYDDKTPICIVPLMSNNRKDYYILGDLCATGYLDFVYPESISIEKLASVVTFVKSELKGAVLHLNKINQTSMLYKALSLQWEAIDKSKCVNIAFGEDYDEYFGKLSKSVRQNIRTARNRMQREDKNYSVKVYMRTPLNHKLDKYIDYSSIMKIYHKRAIERNNHGVEVRHILIQSVQNFLNPLSLMQRKEENTFLSVILIDNNVAGFMAGFITNAEKAVVIPRLAINSEYALFCPGTLLINDSIQYLIENSKIKNLDLSRGAEKYKYSMGGKEHINYSFLV